jgi:hypothetical protein
VTLIQLAAMLGEVSSSPPPPAGIVILPDGREPHRASPR